MRSKYSGFFSAGIFALAAGITAVYGFQDFQPQQPKVRFRNAAVAPQANLPDETELEEVDALRKGLAELVALPAPEEDIVDLIALGQQPDPATATFDPAEENGRDSQMGYLLTMVFCSQNKNFCIIDGRFTTEGGQLPDGALIARIEPHRVLLKKGGASYWVYPDRNKLFSGKTAGKMQDGTHMEVR